VKTDELIRRPPVAVAAPRRVDRTGIRRLDSSDLFAGATEIEIAHESAVYRLKITRQGKLILNK